MNISPRFIRYRDAPAYLGMNKNLFDQLVRPTISEVPIGKIGIAFDRQDLDNWADNHKAMHATEGRKNKTVKQDKDKCQKNRRASQRGKIIGTSTKRSEVIDFTRALEQVT